MATSYGPLSLNEILFFFTRATVGAGAPFGIGEDIAKAAVFIAECGYDPGPTVATALRNLDEKKSKPAATLRTLNGRTVIECDQGEQVSVVYTAPMAMDWLKSQGSSPDLRVFIRLLDCPFLMAAFCGTQWGVSIVDETGSERELSTKIQHSTLPGPVDVMITRRQSGFINRRNDILQTGVHINEDAWDIIRAYFTRCLVPSTEESRVGGAGAGLVDRD